MKKTIALLLAVVMLIGITPAVLADEVKFVDLDSSHWAYNNIITLVGEGTIKGYPDSTFKPEALVTRAEFAKMVGPTDKVKTGDFKDLTSKHWSYEYVMKSGIDADKEYFRPDEYMLRGEVVDALYKRCGTKLDITLPNVILNQSEDKDAITWAYATKLMIGNDGVDLRLNDTVTRAEVTALIIRARGLDTVNLKGFKDNLSDKLAEKILDTSKLFNKKYDANAKLTNGEVAHASLMLAYGSDVYVLDNGQPVKYGGKYETAVNILANNAWGKEYNTLEFENKNANMQDTLLALMDTVAYANGHIIPGGKMEESYPDALDAEWGSSETLLKSAYKHGVFLSFDKKLNPIQEITMKDFVCLMIMTDEIKGFVRNYSNGEYVNAKFSKDSAHYVANHTDFSVILDEIPAQIYQTPFGQPTKSYNTVNGFSEVFKAYFDNLSAYADAKGLFKLDYTFYPSLVSIEAKNIKLRIKCKFTDVKASTMVSAVFPKSSVEDFAISENMTYYFDIVTNCPMWYELPIEDTQLVNVVTVTD